MSSSSEETPLPSMALLHSAGKCIQALDTLRVDSECRKAFSAVVLRGSVPRGGQLPVLSDPQGGTLTEGSVISEARSPEQLPRPFSLSILFF